MKTKNCCRILFLLVATVALTACNSKSSEYTKDDSNNTYENKTNRTDSVLTSNSKKDSVASNPNKVTKNPVSTSRLSSGNNKVNNDDSKKKKGVSPDDGMFGWDPNYENPDGDNDIDYFMNEYDDEWE